MKIMSKPALPKDRVKLGAAKRLTRASFDGNQSELIGDKLIRVGG